MVDAHRRTPDETCLVEHPKDRTVPRKAEHGLHSERSVHTQSMDKGRRGPVGKPWKDAGLGAGILDDGKGPVGWVEADASQQTASRVTNPNTINRSRRRRSQSICVESLKLPPCLIGQREVH